MTDPRRSTHVHGSSHSRTLRLLVVCLLTTLPIAAPALSAQETGPPPDSLSLYPTLQTTREVIVSSAGAAVVIAAFAIPIDVREVPPRGLDPADIRFSIDRRIVGNQSIDAANASDWTRNAAFLMPLALAAFTGPGDRRWHRMGRRAAIYGEAFLLTMGLTALGKSGFSRPRPFTYLSDDERPDDPYYDPTVERAFVSMPSGHASSAWTATGLTVTEFLLNEPAASAWGRAGVGFVGGALAGATAALRVHAGQHFPTDVAVGSLLGLGSGVAVPLLHHGATPLPSTRAWLQTSAGMLVGTVTGVLLSGALF
jgi:membrane-associated phospholipid phosphatase